MSWLAHYADQVAHFCGLKEAVRNLWSVRDHVHHLAQFLIGWLLGTRVLMY